MGGRRTLFSAGTTTPMYETQASHVVYPGTHTNAYTRADEARVCVRSCLVRRAELVDDPGDVNDFHGKFSPPKMAKLAARSSAAPGIPDRESAVALINGLPMYIFRPRSIPPPLSYFIANIRDRKY